MSIQDLGSLGELVGGIAVVVTLAYLAIQLRQSNRLARANTRLEVQRLFDHFREFVISNPQVLDIYSQGRSDPSSLVGRDHAIYQQLIGQQFNVHSATWYTSRSVGIRRLVEESFVNIVELLLSDPVALKLWDSGYLKADDDLRRRIEIELKTRTANSS